MNQITAPNSMSTAASPAAMRASFPSLTDWYLLACVSEFWVRTWFRVQAPNHASVNWPVATGMRAEKAAVFTGA
jgi:hypothetical protein